MTRTLVLLAALASSPTLAAVSIEGNGKYDTGTVFSWASERALIACRAIPRINQENNFCSNGITFALDDAWTNLIIDKSAPTEAVFFNVWAKEVFDSCGKNSNETSTNALAPCILSAREDFHYLFRMRFQLTTSFRQQNGINITTSMQRVERKQKASTKPSFKIAGSDQPPPPLPPSPPLIPLPRSEPEAPSGRKCGSKLWDHCCPDGSYSTGTCGPCQQKSKPKYCDSPKVRNPVPAAPVGHGSKPSITATLAGSSILFHVLNSADREYSCTLRWSVRWDDFGQPSGNTLSRIVIVRSKQNGLLMQDNSAHSNFELTNFSYDCAG